MNNKFIAWAIGIVALAALVIGSVALVGGNHQSQAFGGITTGTNFTHGISVGNTATLGTTPTNVSKVLANTCNATMVGSTFAASSTAQFICAVTGVVSGDLVSIELPVGAGTNSNGAGSLSLGFSVVSAYATSSNQIGFTLANLTGAATSSFAQATTGIAYRVIGTQ